MPRASPSTQSSNLHQHPQAPALHLLELESACAKEATRHRDTHDT